MVLRALRAFVAFHRLGTISAVAHEVHLSPAAVSAQFKLLEERLGVTLFVRTKRSMTLSSEGFRMLPVAEKMLATYEELLQLSDHSSLQGRISLGVINTVLIGVFPAVLQRLKAENPFLRVKVTMGTSPDLVAQVEAGLLDAAVVNQPPSPVDVTMAVHRLYADPVALVQPSSFPHGSLSEAVSQSPYIALDRSTWMGRAIDQFLLQRNISKDPILELDSQIAILAAVRYGLGVSVLPLIRGTSPEADTFLRFVPLDGLERVVTLVERKSHPYAHLTAELMRTITSVAETAGNSI